MSKVPSYPIVSFEKSIHTLNSQRSTLLSTSALHIVHWLQHHNYFSVHSFFLIYNFDAAVVHFISFWMFFAFLFFFGLKHERQIENGNAKYVLIRLVNESGLGFHSHFHWLSKFRINCWNPLAKNHIKMNTKLQTLVDYFR